MTDTDKCDILVGAGLLTILGRNCGDPEYKQKADDASKRLTEIAERRRAGDQEMAAWLREFVEFYQKVTYPGAQGVQMLHAIADRLGPIREPKPDKPEEMAG